MHVNITTAQVKRPPKRNYAYIRAGPILKPKTGGKIHSDASFAFLLTFSSNHEASLNKIQIDYLIKYYCDSEQIF